MKKTLIYFVVSGELARRKRMSEASDFARRVLGKEKDNLELIRSVADIIKQTREQ